jgi:hypothetical protein
LASLKVFQHIVWIVFVYVYLVSTFLFVDSRKAMKQAEELRRAIQELEARKQAMVSIMLPRGNRMETKLPETEATGFQP